MQAFMSHHLHGTARHGMASRRITPTSSPHRRSPVRPAHTYHRPHPQPDLLLVQLFTSTCRWANVRQTEQKISRII